MFGFFKKKDPSKSITKGKPIQNEQSQTIQKSKPQQVNSKKPTKLKTQSRQITNKTYYEREQTQGQFIQKRKKQKKLEGINKKSQKLQKQKQQNPTPKIKNKISTRDIEQKDTERPHKQFNQNIQKSNQEINKQNVEKNAEYLEYQSPKQITKLQTYEDYREKQAIDLKAIIKTLNKLKTMVQQQHQLLISRQFKKNKLLKATHDSLFYSKYFRFHTVSSITELIERYSQILQSIQILLSKLNNRIGKGVHYHKNQIINQQKLQKIYISNQQQFILFFKHFFSKPYTLCNRQSTRKIIQILWQNIVFKSQNLQKLYNQIKLWIYGLSVPVNPSLIILQQIIFKNPESIPKYAKMIFNDRIYIGINQVDPLINSPLILASLLSNKKSLQKLIKSYGNPFLSPLSVKKNDYSYEYSQTKYKKHIFTINHPQYSKKVLSPMQNILMVSKNLNLLSDCFYFMQLANIRSMKKSQIKIKQKLFQIPDCGFQICWKTYRGILNFKQLPSDIITIYKKGSILRIDYNIDSIQNPIKGRRYTILIKAQNQKNLQYYQIRHHNKQIINKLTQIDLNVIKQRFNQFCSYPQARNSQITSTKGMYEITSAQQNNKKINISLNINLQTQQINPQIKKTNHIDYSKPLYKNIAQYEKQIFKSQIIDYKTLQKSYVKSVVEENIVNQKLLPIKLKSKVQKSTIGVEIQFQQQLINLRHIQFILQFFQTDSILLSKFLKIIKIFQNQDVFNPLTIKPFNMLPVSTRITLQKDLTFQIDIKNINYMALNDNIFNVECKVINQMNYQENINHTALDSMQQTVLMEEGYSINVSQFLGKSQKLMQIEDQYARERFQKLLEQFGDNDQQEEGQNRMKNMSKKKENNILDHLEDDD